MTKLSDLEVFFKTIEEMMKPRMDFNVNYNFYYDETNNTRVFKIKNGQLNFHKDKDFVLGGVGVEKGEYNEIEDAFKKMEYELIQCKYTNYQFLDSKDNILVQISDLVVGLLGKLFEFIKKIPIDFIYESNFKISDYYSFDEHHHKGWNLLLNLVSKSIHKNEAFINMPSNKLFRAKFNKIMDLDYQEFLI